MANLRLIVDLEIQMTFSSKHSTGKIHGNREFFGGRDPFASFFGGSMFSDPFFTRGSLFDNDPFFSKRARHSLVDDDFFGDNSFFSSSSSNGFGSMGSSISTTTTIQNGKRVTVTKKTTRDAQGNTTVEKTIDDGSGQIKRERHVNGVSMLNASTHPALPSEPSGKRRNH
jgi:hypothetical protein